jgi:hypothetical protein
VTNDAPEPTRRCARENRVKASEQLEYILRHGSGSDVRAYAAALLIRGLPDPEYSR